MDKAECRHEQVLEELVARLQKKHSGKNTYLALHEDYPFGERDVALYIHKDGKTHRRYYEVKGRHTLEGLNRALTQFRTHHVHNPERWKYIYVTPTTIMRIHTLDGGKVYKG
jgi:hypothetical protein